MTVSMKVMSAGDGYKYLLRSVVAGDGNRAPSTPLTRYYAEAGTPPGRWLGSGLHALGQGALSPGDPVSEQQLALLLGAGRDPVSGERLGLAFPQYVSIANRVTSRVADLSTSLNGEQRRAAIAQIEFEENALGESRAVAGFDLTFSVPKSVSVLWGVSDAGTQAQIVEAHHAAVADVVDLFEREVAATRVGRSNGAGAVAQVEVVGVIAAAFDHWDSRLGDPQLHTHVVVSNKVKTVVDGKWRSIDSRALHAGVVAMSEHYNAILADRVTRQFGIDWEQRARGRDRNPSWELSAVPERLIGAFSGRSRAIEVEKERLICEYFAAHGKRPSSKTVIRLRAQASLATRPEKQVRSLADLTGEWRERADGILAANALAWARGVSSRRGPTRTLRADDIDLEVIAMLGDVVVASVSEKRATWRHWNLWAEASRQTMGWRFASAVDREAVVGMIVDVAVRRSLRVTPPELASSPAIFTHADGTSRFRPRHSIIYTSTELLAAEDRLIARSKDRTAPVVDLGVMDRLAHSQGTGQQPLSEEQAHALARIAVSGRRVDLLIGPAGAGKTTAMHALRRAWQVKHGIDSVVGLAPSAAAAEVLADDLGITCENTAKWLHEHDCGRATFEAGQLVIIDEATLAGTLTLDRITGLAETAGAKVLLVGDLAQLQSVDAGGAFGLLADARDDAPELTEVHRFTHNWEKAASLKLRAGTAEVISTYSRHERIREGTTAEMLDVAYAAWNNDVSAGKSSVLVTDASHAVIELNARARAERILSGVTAAGAEVRLTTGTHASVGDLVITRRNDRRLSTARGGWVRNGDRWRVTAVGADGSVEVARIGAEGGDPVLLPAAYVAEHVDLGYAVTAHRAQGITVDTAHVVVNSSTTRENMYVAMTRGRDANTAYVALDRPDDNHAAPDIDDITARSVLHGVLQHCGAELSAHQMIEAEQDHWGSIAQLAAEYETIAAVAQRHRWVALINHSGLTPNQAQAVIESDSFGPLAAELRRTEAHQFHPETLLPRVVNRRSLSDAEDIGAVLVSRLRHATRSSSRRNCREPDLIAGIVPPVSGALTEEMATALQERRQLIEARAAALAQRALSQHESWLRTLGRPPTEPERVSRWLTEASTVAAYRDRFQITGTAVLGRPATYRQRLDAACAARAIGKATKIAAEADRDHGSEARQTGRQGITH